jgi:mono/diheme cytochrome c family protein
MRLSRAALSLSLGLLLAGTPLLLLSCGSSAQGSPDAAPHVVGPSKEAIGRYILLTSGCNDCHTPGAMEGHLPPESQWLTGTPLGFKGPWGTTYPPNLRLKTVAYTEETFVKAIRQRIGTPTARPPMPWDSLHNMTDANLGALFCYIHSLGPAGSPMPEPRPPNAPPAGPYIPMAPPAIGHGTPATSPATQPTH